MERFFCAPLWESCILPAASSEASHLRASRHRGLLRQCRVGGLARLCRLRRRGCWRTRSRPRHSGALGRARSPAAIGRSHHLRARRQWLGVHGAGRGLGVSAYLIGASLAQALLGDGALAIIPSAGLGGNPRPVRRMRLITFLSDSSWAHLSRSLAITFARTSSAPSDDALNAKLLDAIA